MQTHESSTYASQEPLLSEQIDSLLNASSATGVSFFANTIIVPNSPRLEGGPVLADVYKSLSDTNFDTVISISPSQVGEFRKITVCSTSHYHTPLGDVEIDDRIRNELCDEDDDIYLDDAGHCTRYGLDVQLPFLQRLLGDFTVVPLVMGSETVEFCKELGSAIGEIMFNRNTLTVACVDILEATPIGMERFEKYIRDLDTARMMCLLNQENEILVRGKGGVLSAMIAASHRRANRVHVAGIQPPGDDMPGCVGALIGRG